MLASADVEDEGYTAESAEPAKYQLVDILN